MDRQGIEQQEDLIKAKLRTENAQDHSDAEIERCFKNCAGKTRCIQIAKGLRDRGELNI